MTWGETKPERRAFDVPLAPEEVELVDEWLADKMPLDAPAVVYVHHLADGAAYVGLTNDVRRRHRQHHASAQRTPTGGEQAVTFKLPSGAFLALHGEPDLVAVVSCPTRRHAFLAEGLITAQIENAGIHVFGSRWDLGDKWQKNEARGQKVDDAAPLVAALWRRATESEHDR